MILKQLYLIAARFFLGGVFLYSGLVKLFEPVENFRGAIASYDVIPYEIVPWIAYVFPWLELVFGVFLILGFLPRLSALVLAFFSLSFMALIATTYLVHGELPAGCGCFGEGGLHLTPLQVIILDAVNTLLGLSLAIHKEHPLTHSNRLGILQEGVLSQAQPDIRFGHQ